MGHTTIAEPPDQVHPPMAPYTHGLEVAPNQRFVYISGQVPLAADGTIPDGITAQTEQAWQNLLNTLVAADMTMTDVVRLTHYIVGRAHLDGYNAARARFMGGVKPASTLLLVAGLADPAFLVEVDAVAAKPA